MTLRLVTRPSGLLIPVDDLGIKGTLPGQLTLGDDLPFVLALNAGFDGNQSRLLKVDGNGNLRVSTAGQAAPGAVRIQDGAGVTLLSVQIAGNQITPSIPAIAAEIALTDSAGGTNQWSRASAVGLSNQSGINAGIVASPGEWSTNHAPGAGTAASAVRAAGGAGVRHIGKRVSFTMSSQAALAGVATVTINIRDGASGAGAVLEQYNIDLPAAIVAPFQLLMTGLNLVGSAATAMTAEMSAAVAGLRASISIAGYDAN